MSRHRQKSSRNEVVISDDEESEKFYSKDRSSHRSSEISKRSKRSDRREIASYSDDHNSEKIYSKDKYSYTSDTSKRRAKHKKSKKASKKQSESSSESEDEYDSRKENKTEKKHRKKLSKDRYEKKSDNSKYSKDSEKYRSDKAYESDSSEKVYSSKSSRKRNRSQENQRYGKWAEGVDKNKDKSAINDDAMIYESKNKRVRRDNSVDGLKKKKRKNDSDDEERHTNYHQRRKTDYDNLENYQSNSKLSRKERPDKYSKSRLESNDEHSENVQRDYPSKYDERNRYPESDKHYRKDSDRYDRNEKKEFDYDRNREDYYRENRKMSRKPYVDFDDPNQRKEEGRVENNETNNEDKVSKKVDDVEPLSKRLKIGNINTRTGGAYIPPARLRMMQEKIKDKGSEEYQRIAWEALKKSIVGMTNKVNSSNISDIVIDLFKENIIRGRGVLARAIMQAQGASPTFTRVYAALVCVINTKFPEIGELILKRLIIQYKRGFRRNDKTICMNAARFVAHLLNQEVAHEVLILEMVTHLLENPTEDSIEIAIATLKECGKKLTQLSARGMRAITQRVRNVLHEGNVDARVRYMIEVFFAVQKDGFKDFEIVPKELDLVEDEDKYTHLMNLDDAVDTQDMLNVFKFDPEYIENEEKYKSVAKEILGDSDEEEGSGAESGSEGEEEEDEEKKNEEKQEIIDMTETNIVCLRRKIYLTIQSSLDFEECAHKLLKLELKPGQILEMCYMILDCCAQQRTYEKFFGLLGQRFCQLNKIYVEPFTEIFENSYKTIHRLETNKLRNVAKFFAHLLFTDAISWNVLSIIKLNENDTTSSSRIFIKILFQELCEYMGLTKLNERVKDITLQEAFDGLFPRDLPHNTRFAINFFTSIGLGGLTDELREHLKNLPKTTTLTVAEQLDKEDSASSSSSASDSDSTSSSSSDSDSD